MMELSAQRRRLLVRPRRVEETDAVAVDLPEEEALPLLQEGEIIGGQRIPWGSNNTFLVYIDAGPGRYLLAVYKPRNGERPLHDFPSGSLYKREYAAYVLSQALGWPRVPLTVIRDGPQGIGSIQYYVQCDPHITYFDLIDGNAEELLRFAVFDVLSNNADRKAGHCLLGSGGRIWSIDHGLTMHSIFKMRTVMLEFQEASIPQPILKDVGVLAGRLESNTGLAGELAELLTEREINALLGRIETVLKEPVVPRLDPYRNVPWPLV